MQANHNGVIEKDFQPQTLSIATGFPVQWSDPNDAQLFWQMNKVNHPDAILPLEFSYRQIFSHGWRAAAQAYELPIVGLDVRRINTYLYSTILPLKAPPAELKEKREKAESKFKGTMARLDTLWETEWLPEIQEHLAFWESYDLNAASGEELLIHFHETCKRMARLWEIHFLVVFPARLAISLFEELYCELFDKEAGLNAYRLLEGFNNKSLERDQALWRLSRQARRCAKVTDVLTACKATDVISELGAFNDGQDFLAELQVFLNEYGYISNKVGALNEPLWIEEPSSAIEAVKDFLCQPDRNLTEELNRVTEEREEHISELHEKLKDYPQPVIGQFNFLLKAAQQGNILLEDHAYWIDQRGQFQLRKLVLELGKRLANMDMLANPNHIFYLSFEEIDGAVRSTNQGNTMKMLAVQERIAEIEHYSGITPPTGLGKPPAGPPPDNAFIRSMNKFFGVPVQTKEDQEPSDKLTTIRGHAGSPGTVRGTVKVLQSLDETVKLQLGDILVTETTMPAWTSLFATAGAVITNSGGVLSHCAIVAREYRIPAVVGTGNATHLLSDGQQIEVNGNTGVVHIL